VQRRCSLRRSHTHPPIDIHIHTHTHIPRHLLPSPQSRAFPHANGVDQVCSHSWRGQLLSRVTLMGWDVVHREWVRECAWMATQGRRFGTWMTQCLKRRRKMMMMQVEGLAGEANWPSREKLFTRPPYPHTVRNCQSRAASDLMCPPSWPTGLRYGVDRSTKKALATLKALTSQHPASVGEPAFPAYPSILSLLTCAHPYPLAYPEPQAYLRHATSMAAYARLIPH
jgi:hypothetical protein